MSGTTNTYPGVTLVDLPRPGWIPLHLAPFRYALDLDPEPGTLDLTAFEPGEVLEAAGVTSKVNWSTGTLGLHVPCERGAQRFTEGGAVVAASAGDGIVKIWGDPLNFHQTPDERLTDLTTPALARAIRERVSEWWDKLTFLAVGHFSNSDSLTEAAWAGIMVARINSPLAKFAQLPPDAFDAIAITDWRRGQAERRCGARLYAMHYAPAERAAQGDPIESAERTESGDPAKQAAEIEQPNDANLASLSGGRGLKGKSWGVARRAIEFMEGEGVPIGSDSGLTYGDQVRLIQSIAQEKGREGFRGLSAGALAKALQRP